MEESNCCGQSAESYSRIGLFRTAPIMRWIAQWEHTAPYLSANGEQSDSPAFVTRVVRDAKAHLWSPHSPLSDKDMDLIAKILGVPSRTLRRVRHEKSPTGGGQERGTCPLALLNSQPVSAGVTASRFLVPSRVADTDALLVTRLESLQWLGMPNLVRVAEQMLFEFRAAAEEAYVSDPFVSVSRFARECGISRSTIRRRIEAGDLPALRVRKLYFLIRSAA